MKAEQTRIRLSSLIRVYTVCHYEGGTRGWEKGGRVRGERGEGEGRKGEGEKEWGEKREKGTPLYPHPLCLHILDALFYCKTTCFKF